MYHIDQDASGQQALRWPPHVGMEGGATPASQHDGTSGNGVLAEKNWAAGPRTRSKIDRLMIRERRLVMQQKSLPPGP